MQQFHGLAEVGSRLVGLPQRKIDPPAFPIRLAIVERKLLDLGHSGLRLLVALLFGELAGAYQVQIDAARRQIGLILGILRLILDQCLTHSCRFVDVFLRLIHSALAELNQGEGVLAGGEVGLQLPVVGIGRGLLFLRGHEG